jgi:hypothetical protein
MKPLILSFFAILLVYSLWIDGDGRNGGEEINRIRIESHDTLRIPDSIPFYAWQMGQVENFVELLVRFELPFKNN